MLISRIYHSNEFQLLKSQNYLKSIGESLVRIIVCQSEGDRSRELSAFPLDKHEALELTSVPP